MSATPDTFDPVEPPAGKYRVRRMEERDIPAIMAIERRAYEFPWTEAIFRDCMRFGNCCRVVELDGEIVAYVVMAVGGGEAHLLNLCTRPELRRRGLGRMMLMEMLELARRLAAEAMFLEVRPSNDAARKLYHEAGFNEISVRRHYYPAKLGREDALILARQL